MKPKKGLLICAMSGIHFLCTLSSQAENIEYEHKVIKYNGAASLSAHKLIFLIETYHAFALLSSKCKWGKYVAELYIFWHSGAAKIFRKNSVLQQGNRVFWDALEKLF